MSPRFRRSAAGAVAIAGLAGLLALQRADVPAGGSAGRLVPDAAAAGPQQALPGETFRDCPDVCPQMVVVPAGSFTMGSSEFHEGPPHQVTIGKPFAVGKLEVTFAEWEACVAANGCKSNRDRIDMAWRAKGWARGDHPVVSVTWGDAKAYATWLSRKTGKSYRLLTEAEWEYAARAGSATAYSWGDGVGEGNANCDGCGSKWDNGPAPAGSFKPNAFGVHDMHGNVWEWVEDCFHAEFDGAPGDGSAWTADCTYPDDRVHRGGAFLHGPSVLRATVRNNYKADSWANGVGFRIARAL